LGMIDDTVETEVDCAEARDILSTF